MNKNKYNPYENMLAVLDEAASRLGLKEADYITLRYPEREMIVSILPGTAQQRKRTL